MVLYKETRSRRRSMMRKNVIFRIATFAVSASLFSAPVMAGMYGFNGMPAAVMPKLDYNDIFNFDGDDYDDYDDWDDDWFDDDYDDYDDYGDDYDDDNGDYWDGEKGEKESSAPVPRTQPAQAYENQVKLTLHEQKIISPAFNNAVIGRMTVPDGWNIQVEDLSLGSESIICPNAVMVTVSAPDGSCRFKYVSRREFEQRLISMSGYNIPSEDDTYDYTGLMHYLNYRNADATCDLMAGILFNRKFAPTASIALTQEEESQVAQAQAAYTNAITSDFTRLASSGITPGELKGVELTMAKKNYITGKYDVSVCACSCGYEICNEGYGAVYDTIMWAMPFVFAMETEGGKLEQYREAFDVFCASTSVSQEYEKMRSMNAERLTAELLKAQNNNSTYDYGNNSGRYEDIENETIDSGESYSAIDAWDDYIRDETDYTTGDGSHIKIPSNFEHVFEGDDGTIYYGNSLDGPYGSTELNPTQIGE